MDVSREKPLSFSEAVELIKWKETTLENATKKVLVGDGYGTSFREVIPYFGGKVQRYFMGKPVNSIREAAEMLLSPTEKAMVEIADAYDQIIEQHWHDGGGFDEMAKAYAAGVPIEDILV